MQEVAGSQQPLAGSSLPAAAVNAAYSRMTVPSMTLQGNMHHVQPVPSLASPSTAYLPFMPAMQANAGVHSSLQSLAAPYTTAAPMLTSLPGASSSTAPPLEVAFRGGPASGVSQSQGNRGAATNRADCQPIQSVQLNQLEHQKPQRDEWLLSDDENDCQREAAAPSSAQDAELVQLLEMGFTPKQAMTVSSRIHLAKRFPALPKVIRKNKIGNPAHGSSLAVL